MGRGELNNTLPNGVQISEDTLILHFVRGYKGYLVCVGRYTHGYEYSIIELTRVQ